MQQADKTIIEAKLPLWWIIGSATAIIFAMGGLFVKLEAVGETLNKVEIKLNQQDGQFSSLIKELSDVKSVNSVQQLQIDRATSDVNELSRFYRSSRQ